MEPGILDRARLAVELSEGLCLLFVIGPPERAREGLQRVRAHLPEDRHTRWHRLDRDGLDLLAAAGEAGPGAVLLVHGLELLVYDDRVEAEGLLNLARDRLGALDGAVVLYLPDDEAAAFVRRAPDLYAWRSLVIQLEPDDLPLPPEEVARRRWLIAHVRALDHIEAPSWWMREGRRPMSVHSHFVEPEVVLPGGEVQGLFAWADSVRFGLLCGPRGSGRRTALFALARRAALRALEDPEAPVPVVINWETMWPRGEDWLGEAVESAGAVLGLGGDLIDVKSTNIEIYLLRYDWFGRPTPLLRDIRPALGEVSRIFVFGHSDEGGPVWQPAHLQPWDGARRQVWLARAVRRSAGVVPAGRERGLEEFLSVYCFGGRADLDWPPVLGVAPSGLDAPVLAGRSPSNGRVLASRMRRERGMTRAVFEVLKERIPKRADEIDATASREQEDAVAGGDEAETLSSLDLPSMTAFVDEGGDTEFVGQPLFWRELSAAWIAGTPQARTREISALARVLLEALNMGPVAELTRAVGVAALYSHPRTGLFWHTHSGYHENVGGPRPLNGALPPNDETRRLPSLYESDLMLLSGRSGVIEPAGENFRFTHPVLRDWFAAYAVLAEGSDVTLRFATTCADDPQWFDVVRFLVGLAPPELADELLTAIEGPSPHRQRLLAACRAERAIPPRSTP